MASPPAAPGPGRMRDERSDSRSSEVEDQKDCGAGGETVPERAEDPDPAAEFNDDSEGGTDHTTTLPMLSTGLSLV